LIRLTQSDGQDLHADQQAIILRHHPVWQPQQAQTAAEGGAGRKSAKIADAPINQSREAHPLGAAAPLP
jgi:hypothetical protein